MSKYWAGDCLHRRALAAARIPSALACLGPPGSIAASTALVRQVLALAAQSGSTPHQIITGAAAAMAPARTE
jgi:hypothetical protein